MMQSASREEQSYRICDRAQEVLSAAWLALIDFVICHMLYHFL